MTDNIVLTTGIYDLIKDHLRRKRSSKEEEEILTAQLRNTQQILRKDMPEDVVSVNTLVKIKNHKTSEEEQYRLVPPAQHKAKKGKYSILSDIGLAMVGNKVGDVITWPFEDGERQIEIVGVEALA